MGRCRSRAAGRRIGRAAVLSCAALIIAVALLAARCGNSDRDAHDTLKSFLEFSKQGNDKAAYGLLSTKDRTEISEEEWLSEVKQMEESGEAPDFDFVLSGVEVRGKEATAAVLLIDKSRPGDSSSMRFTLVKEGDGWKVELLRTTEDIGSSYELESTAAGLPLVDFGKGLYSPTAIAVWAFMFLAVYVFYAICIQRISRNLAVSRSWFAWIPILNIYLTCRIVGKGILWTVLCLLPVVSIIMYIIICFKLARVCGKGRLYGLLLLIPLVNFVVLWILVGTSGADRDSELGGRSPDPRCHRAIRAGNG